MSGSVTNKVVQGMEDKLVEYLDGRAKRCRAARRGSSSDGLRRLPHARRRISYALSGTSWTISPLHSPSASFDASLRARIAAEPVRQSFWAWLPSPRLAFASYRLGCDVGLVVLDAPHHTISGETHLLAKPGRCSAQMWRRFRDADFGMIRDLPVLENYDVLSKFDALSELPVSPDVVNGAMTRETR